MGEALTNFGFNIIIITDSKFNRFERFLSWCKVNLILAPVSYVLSGLGFWIHDNHVFVSFMLGTITINLLLGGYVHWQKVKDFNWATLLTKTVEMCIVTIAVYAVLEMVLILASKNVVTDLFRISVQISTMIYPMSKIIKNSHILTGGEFPPKWLMRKFFKLQRDGDISNFISSDGHNQLEDDETN